MAWFCHRVHPASLWQSFHQKPRPSSPWRWRGQIHRLPIREVARHAGSPIYSEPAGRISPARIFLKRMRAAPVSFARILLAWTFSSPHGRFQNGSARRITAGFLRCQVESIGYYAGVSTAQSTSHAEMPRFCRFACPAAGRRSRYESHACL